ncbi:MAG: hypothetical protein JWQ58_3840 [Reyranella sp.]|nr:hypothetical protein [Reyranella sp.]
MTLESGGRLPALSPTGPLRPSFPVWGLFGRWLLLIIGQILIVPAPWTTTGFYRFLCDHVALPDGRRLRFAGQPGDIWYFLVGLAALGWLHQSQHAGASAVATLATAFITVPVLRWFCANVRTEDDRLRLSFDGEVLAFVGWNILLIVSVITIVGWAWVLKAMIQWLCANIRGTVSFTFSATGLSVLGHSLLMVLLCILIIPIPWALRWYADWFASQFSAVEPTRSA